MKRFKKLVLFIAIIGVIFSSFSLAKAKEKVIKVGFPIQEGLTEKDEHGNYSGYTYDYLREIAQYTGWTFEFVEVEGDINQQLITLLDMLEKGEIDILGAMSYSEQNKQKYDFPSENYGNAYSVIAVDRNRSAIDEYNISDYKGVRIALQKQAMNRNELFFQYASLNDIEYEIVWCESYDEQIATIENGKADAILSVNLSLPSTMRSIIKFSPTPFYFATTKGNSYVVSELNQAITYISEVYPTLQTELYNRYFNKKDTNIYLNAKEKEHVKKHTNIKVLVHDGFGPLEYTDKEGNINGVANDVLTYIAKKVGWELTYVYAKTYDEYEKIIMSNGVDLVLSVDYDYDEALKKEMLLSNPYLETEKVIVAREGINIGELADKKEAIYKGKRTDEQDNNDYFDSLEEVLNAVENGTCDYAYMNSYAASYYQYRNHHEHTIIYPQMTDDTARYSIGIVNREDKVLSTIINKGIQSIEASEIEAFIYKNAQQNQDFTFMQLIKENPLISFGFIALFLVFVFLILYTYYREKLKMSKKSELENRRYRYLSDMTSEVTFTYDYVEDLMILSKEGQGLFEAEEEIKNYSKYQSKLVIYNEKITLLELLMSKEDIDKQIFLQLPYQEKQWYRLIIKIIYDEQMAVSAVGRFQNINSDMIEKENLLQFSRLDGLTQLFNASTVKEEITNKLKDNKEQYAFAIIDIDNFKGVNDTHGHYIGDKVLVETANAMKEVFKENALLGRLGGDEFIIFLKYTNKERLEELTEMLLQEIHYLQNKTNLPIPTLSIGVALYKVGDDFNSLYQRADEMLYNVKNEGKNNYHIE